MALDLLDCCLFRDLEDPACTMVPDLAQWFTTRRLRIVRYPDLDLPWHVLRRCRLFPWVWHGLTGRDRGAPGCYNWQLQCYGNPAAPLLRALPALWTVRRRRLTAVWHQPAESLPRWPIDAELDGARALALLVQGATRMTPIEEMNAVIWPAVKQLRG